MLIDRAREIGEVPELRGSGRELPEPVVAQAEQLADRRHVGIRLAQRTHDAHRVTLVPGVERLGRALELLERASRTPARRRASSSTLASVERTGRRFVGVLLRARCFGL